MVTMQRASREEIFQRLRALLGEEAVEAIEEIVRLYNQGNTQAALQALRKYDSRLGGTGIYMSEEGKKLPGVYRALSYVEIHICQRDAHQLGRFIVQASCGYLEGLLKKLGLRWWCLKAIDRLPLGRLVRKIDKYLPPDLADHLLWLNDGLWVFAKHVYDLEAAGREISAPEHSFDLDEAIAVYFIARALGRQLEELRDKPRETLLER